MVRVLVILKMLVHRLRQSFQRARSFTTSTVRQGGHHDDYGGLPGDVRRIRFFAFIELVCEFKDSLN